MQEISVPRQCALHASLMSEGQIRSYLTEYAARGRCSSSWRSTQACGAHEKDVEA